MLTNIIKKLIYREKYDQSMYVTYFKKKGVKIGERVNIFVSTKPCIDMIGLF